MNSDEVSEYGCDTKDSCIYEEKGSDSDKRYCFKRGGQVVPDCVQKLPPCAKYFFQPAYDIDDSQNPIWKMRTFVYSTADIDTCVAPTFPDLSWDPTISWVSSFQLGSDLLLFDGSAEIEERMKLEGDSWKSESFQTPTDFPSNEYVIAGGSTALYAVGGSDKDRRPLDTVFKSVDGFNWEKLPWTMDKQRRYLDPMFSCITKNEESGNDNLVVMGGNNDASTEIQAYDLVTNRVVIDMPDAGFNVMSSSNQLVCHNGWMYVADPSSNLYMLKLKDGAVKADIEKTNYSLFAMGGQLVVYDNKIGVVGGVKENNNGDTVKQENFVYYDGTGVVEGASFPAYGFATKNNPLVPVVTK